jgi:hypothetical protein
MASEFKIGRLRYTWKGAWVTNTFYNRDAVASYNGKTYVCIVPHTSTDFYANYYNVEESGEIKPYWVIMLEGTSWKGEWLPSTLYTLGAIVLYGGSVYKCVVNHTSSSTITLANWEVYATINSTWIGDYEVGTQYKVGDAVKYGGNVYTCIVEHLSPTLITHPTYAKWEFLYVGIEFKGTWDSNEIAYKINDVVKYGADLWKCNQDHLSELPFDGTTTLGDTGSLWTIWIPGLEFGSTWNSSTIYQPGDTVMYGGYSYISKTVNNQGNTPPVSTSGPTADWELLTIGYSLQNTWNTSTQYKIGSVVNRGGYSFTAIQDTQGNDPSNATLTKSYNATGSSGTTIKVNNTIGLVPGMIVTGDGFELGQAVVEVIDANTLTVSLPPYSTITNGASLKFVGVDGDNWALIVPGTRWRNRWFLNASYIPGDIVVWVNGTYRCIQTHSASEPSRPDIDTSHLYWILFLKHDQYNVLNIPGDIVVNSEGTNTALAIGPEGFLLKSVNGVPTWQNVFQTPAVYYVSPNGTDLPGSGTTWDNPYQSIKYACGQVINGTLNTQAKNVLTANKAFLVEEIANWVVVQSNQNATPFSSTVPIDSVKTRRDTRYLIDAVIYDLSRGGNSQTIAFAVSFFDKEYSNKFITTEVANQIDTFIATLNKLFELIYNVASSVAISPLYQSINSASSIISQSLSTPVDSSVIVDIESYQTIIITALTDESLKSIPSENQGLTATINVKTGAYHEELPIVVPANTAINGDELRGVIVYPKNIINTIATRSTTGTNRITVKSTDGMENGTAVQFVSLNPISQTNTVFGGLTSGRTYYVVGNPTATQFSVSEDIGGSPVQLSNYSSLMRVVGGDALKDMFYMQNGTGMRNMTLSGLLGTLSSPNTFTTRRPTGGSFVSLDPGQGPTDTSAWIYRKSPYIQNVTTFGTGCVGLKIDGNLHQGGNKSIVCNDFTQICSDGIGVYVIGPDALCEAVSVFSYYAYAGYFAEDGGRLRATNGNSSYGTFGVVAEGFNTNETPITGNVDNRYYEATATPLSSLGANAEILKLQYSHAGEQYVVPTTNLLKYSNVFTNWAGDGNVTLIQSIVSPDGESDGWIATGNTSGTNSSYFYQNVTVAPSGASYTAIGGTNESGSGTLATFNISVSSTAYIVTVNSGGSGYVATNEIRILGSVLGGINGDNDLMITVATLINGTEIQSITSTGTVPVGSTQPYVFSMYCKKGTSSTFDIEANFSGYSAVTSAVSFNFNTLSITPSGALTGGMTPVTYAAIPVSNAAGWYRINFEFYDTTALNNSLQIRIYPRSKTGNAGYTLLYGSQLQLGNHLGFYLATTTGQYTGYANYNIIGAGSGVEVVGDEIRSLGIYQTRLLEVNGITGGTNYLSSSNNAQSGDTSSIVIAGSDVAGEKTYLGMRLFVNSGTGAGQYGYISNFDTVSKTASILKDSFDQITVEVTESANDTLSLSGTDDVYSLYTNQPVQFVPTTYDTLVTLVSQSSLSVSSTTGGIINTITVASTARLALNMPVTFSGVTYGGVTSNFTYYVLSIIDSTTIQVSTTVGGSVVLLTTREAPMTLNYPSNTSYLNGSTSNMAVNLPIYFTGSAISDITTGQTYYINEIFSNTQFTISAELATPTATNTTAVTNSITVDNSDNLASLTPIIFTGTGFGGVNPNFKYYINHIIDASHITLATQVTTTTARLTSTPSNLITVDSTFGFIIGNPIVFTGNTFGGIVNDRTYYILYVNDTSTFSISTSSSILQMSVTATTTSTDVTRPSQLTAISTTNLTPLNPITFTGTVFGGVQTNTEYYVCRVIDSTHFTISSTILPVTATETMDVSNLITVGDTTGFVPNNPIIFAGNTFGGIESGRVYYISAVNDQYSLTISATPGGSAVLLTPGTGSVTARTPAAKLALTTASGTMTGTTRYGGNSVNLAASVGECVVRTTNSSVSLTTATGTLSGTSTVAKEVLSADAGAMTGTFKVPLIGGISQGTTYYIRTITTGNPNTFTITDVPGGSTNIPMTDSNGSMKMGQVGWDHVNPGTPLVSSFDSTTVYSIEPRITYTRPPFSVNASSITTQAPSTSYVSVKYGKGKFVGLPNADNILAVSTNGASWSQQQLPVSGTWSDIVYGDNYWVIISSGGSAIPGSKVLYSNSGLVTWKTSYLPSIGTWNKVVYGNGKFVAINTNSSNVAYSLNFGVTWASGTGLASAAWSSLTYGAGIFVAVASGGTAATYSTDGIAWNSAVLPRTTTWSGVAYGNGRFVAVSSTLGTAAYSLDGITWYPSTYSIKANHIAYGNGVFVAVGQESPTPITFISEDGITWISKSSLINMGPIGFGWDTTNNGTFVTVAGNQYSNIINAGSRTKARPIISTKSIIEINEWDPGSNYIAPPTVSIVDTNATIGASVNPLLSSGVLGNPTFVSRGSGYNTNTTSITITGDGYADNYQKGLDIIVNNLTRLPAAGDNFAIQGNATIYKITSAVALDGTVAPTVRARISISPEMTVGLSPDHNSPVLVRTKYSQARLTNHDFLNIGYGNFEESNYPRLPTDTVLSPQNETVEVNYGRVFYSSTDQDGNFRVGELFAVEQATGIVTLSASQFGLSGLTELRIGGIAVGGNAVTITQFSTDSTFVANSNNIVPTQKAIKAYLTARLSQGGSNTFTGQLIAGTVLIGGPDKIASTIPNGNEGSKVRMPNVVNVHAFEGGGWDGNGMAMAFFQKSFARGTE